MSAPPPQPETIARLSEAVFPSFAMLAGMQLDVFSPLEDGPLDSAQIAAAIQVDSAKLGPLLYALVAAGLLQVEDGLFSNTSEAAHFLVRGRPNFLGERHYLWADIWHAVLQTGKTIRSGHAQAIHDFSAMSTEELEAFFRGLHPNALADGKNFANNRDLSSCRTLLDVGGGSGGVAIGLCEAHPALQATILDLPPVVPIAVEMATEAGLSDRISGLAADMLAAPPPGGFDIATARAFFQVLSEDQCRQAAHAIAGSLLPGGRLFLVGLVTGDSGLEPEIAVAMNMVFLNTFENGQAHSESLHRSWLSEAGFSGIERTPFLAGYSLISAVKEKCEFQEQ